MSYSNTVPISSTVLGSLAPPVASNTWYDIALDPASVQTNAGGLMSMALNLSATDVMLINSREAGAAVAPQLVITYAPPTATPVPPTATPVPPTATPVPPTATPVPPTATPVPPTATPVPPTATPVPPTATPVPPAPNPVTLSPVADTYTTSIDPTSTTGGSATVLRINKTGSDTTFLRFDLSKLAGKTITGATLRVHTSTDSWSGTAMTANVNLVASDQWSEASMSYNNTVPISSTVLGSLAPPVGSNAWYDITLDPTSVQTQTGGLLSMALNLSSTDVMLINSREAGASVAPQLVIAYK
jgi:hypothetical protein